MDRLLPAVAFRGLHKRIKSLGLAVRKHNHKFVTVRVAVRPHKRRVLLLINHHVMDSPANITPDESMLKAAEAAPPADLLADYPDTNTAWFGGVEDRRQHGYRIELVSVIEAQIIVGRAGHRQINARLAPGAKNLNSITHNKIAVSVGRFAGGGALADSLSFFPLCLIVGWEQRLNTFL